MPPMNNVEKELLYSIRVEKAKQRVARLRELGAPDMLVNNELAMQQKHEAALLELKSNK